MQKKNYAKEILPVLAEASSLLVSSLELSEILPRAMEIIKDLLLRCEAASIMLVDEKNKKLVFEVALGEKGEEIKKIALPLEKGIAGEVASKGKPIEYVLKGESGPETLNSTGSLPLWKSTSPREFHAVPVARCR